VQYRMTGRIVLLSGGLLAAAACQRTEQREGSGLDDRAEEREAAARLEAAKPLAEQSPEVKARYEAAMRSNSVQTLATLKEALDGLKAQSVGPAAPVEGSPERAALDERIQDLQRRIRDRERRLAGVSARSEQPDP
jgi:hypothetical protein